MNDRTWALCEEALHKALARNGVADPAQALCALLWLLRGRHRADVTAFARRAYREDFELPDPRASTVAESIKDLADSTVGRTVGRPGRDHTVGYTTELIASGMQVVADVLGELIPLWDFEAMEDAPAAPRRTREVTVEGLNEIIVVTGKEGGRRFLPTHEDR